VKRGKKGGRKREGRKKPREEIKDRKNEEKSHENRTSSLLYFDSCCLFL